MEEPLARGVGWPHVFGSAALFLFLMQACTGVLLAVYYVPSPTAAYQSTAYINGQLPLGSLVRGLHHWGASAMLVIVFVHMLQVFFWGAYKRPRQIIWVIGVFLLLATLALSFTGYLLPWDQKAYWATVVGTRIAGSLPVIGRDITTVIRGGETVGALTLTRFFGLHVLMLPALLIGLMVFHISQVRRQGITAPWRRVGDEEAVPRPGLFYPDQVFRDAVVALLLLSLLFGVALVLRAPLETIANPSSTGYKPRPEWYFLPNFQLLTYFPAAWGQWGEFAGAIAIPGLVVLALILLPYLDRNPERRPLRRPFVCLAALASLGTLSYLGIAGAKSGPAPVKLTDIQTRGEKVFLDLRCQSCHGINGGGGMEGVDLAQGGPRDPQKVAAKLRSPTASNPRSVMPPVPSSLSEADFSALVAYVSAIDTRFQMPTEVAGAAPNKPVSHYEENWFANHKYEVRKDPTICAQCHRPSFCQSCHRNRRPDSHLSEWLKFHAGTAHERPEYCQVCNDQSYCDACHSKLMHTAAPAPAGASPALSAVEGSSARSAVGATDWLHRHAQAAKSQGQICLQCHRQAECTACHTGGRPVSHSRPDWLHAHQGANPAECEACHSESFCTDCHQGARPKSHDATWLSRHGKESKPRPQACQTCHQAEFCKSCHGGLDMPHPSNWIITHKAQASFAAGSVCYRCHEYKKTCAVCHGESPPGQ